MTGESGFVAVARSPHLRSLEWLSLARNQVGRRSATALASWPRASAGLKVDLRGCTFEHGARELLLATAAAGEFLIDPPDEVIPEGDE